MRVLVACEYSGVVRRAFAAKGHDAWSCDLLPSEDRSNKHVVGDARELLGAGWDLLMVAHPPCTRLCLSGVRWLHERNLWADLDDAAALYSAFWNAKIDRVCIENPIMHGHARDRIVNFERPAQFVQPWWFGHPVFKATGLNLRGLPKLRPTNRLTPPKRGTVEHREWSFIHRMPPGPDRWRERSRTFEGLAAAMADQWTDPDDISLDLGQTLDLLQWGEAA